MLGLCNDYRSFYALPAGVVEDARELLKAIELRNNALAAKAKMGAA